MITPEQRENRKKGLFASDVARIMTGESVPLVLEKLGEIPPQNFDDVLEVEIGSLIESRIIDAYEAQRPGIVLERNPNTLEFFHPEYSWLGCHPDSITPDRSLNVEVKAVGDYNRGEWGDGGDEVPSKVLWQTLAQMAVTGAPVTEVPVCFLNVPALKMLLTGRLPPIVVFRVDADSYLQDFIIERAQKIWNCIQTRELPMPERLADVRLLYKKDSGLVLEATEAIFGEYINLMAWRKQLEELEEAEERSKLILQSYMKEASELRYNGSRLATWKKDSNGVKFDENSFAEKHPKLHRKFLIPRIGARKFLPKELK